MKDTRIQIETDNDYHLEMFTKYPDDIKSLEYPLLKMGKFRARREDNSIGERYFVSDMREEGELVNAIMVHTKRDKKILSKFDIKPNYSCGRLDVYRFGYYADAHPYKALTITVSGIRTFDKEKSAC